MFSLIVSCHGMKPRILYFPAPALLQVPQNAIASPHLHLLSSNPIVSTSSMKLRLLASAAAILVAGTICSALPSQSTGATSLAARADTSLVGYLGVFFLGDAPNIYFYLSDGNNPLAFKALNKGNPILKPTLGTKGVRDPSIISGNGTEEGKKWYIIGTDLDIAKVFNILPLMLFVRA
jgi:hypothetical protein